MGKRKALELLETVRDGEDGNTKSSSPIKTKQSTQLKYHFLTWNNYPPNGMEIIETNLRPFAQKAKFQEETGENGTPHIQGNFMMKAKKNRWEEFKCPPQCHWEKTRNIEAAFTYCGKDETRTGKTVSWGLPKPIINPLAGKELYAWQKEIEDLHTTEPDGRTINVICDIEGNKGKSVFTKYMYLKHKIVISKLGKYSDIMHLIFETDMDNVRMMIFDIPRAAGNNISYSAIESILDGLIASTKYEGGMKAFNPPHIVVFCNMEPKYEQCSQDRWNVKFI